jgi:hypothetical protein
MQRPCVGANRGRWGVSPVYLATTLHIFDIVQIFTEGGQGGIYSTSYTRREKKTTLHMPEFS